MIVFLMIGEILTQTSAMEQVLSVSQLTYAIKNHLEGSFAHVSVQGEISNFKAQSSGHLYFTLKDGQAQLSCALFRGNTRGLSKMPKDGDKVTVTGSISVYAPRGNYQMIVKTLQFAGVGELLLQLHALKERLEKMGWFDPAIKKPLPKFPRTIGVVTSPTGAVIKDILNVLTRRFAGFHLVLCPVKVQGEGSAKEIAEAIQTFNKAKNADLLIVGRGGGSLEDLWAFNEIAVAEAIHQSEIPVISAVGHETDFTIADMVADLRAPTPSAAAEVAVAEKSQLLDYLLSCKEQATYSIKHRLHKQRLRLQGAHRQAVALKPMTKVLNLKQQLASTRRQLNTRLREITHQKHLTLQAAYRQANILRPTAKILNLKQHLSTTHHQLVQRLQEISEQKKKSFASLISHLKSIDPKNLLTRGYCILFPEKGDSAILSKQNLTPNERIKILMHDGSAFATIDEV